MVQMPYAKKLHEKFENEDVVFLYLANRCSEEAWKATIAEKNMQGEHYLLNNNQYSILAGEFGISGIPHYVLIDKTGNVVNKKAPRPSSADVLFREVERLIKALSQPRPRAR